MHSQKKKKNSLFNKNRVLLKFFMARQGEIQKKSYCKTCLSKNDVIKKRHSKQFSTFFFFKSTTFFLDVARTESLFVLVLLVSLVFSASSSVKVTFDGDLAGWSSIVGELVSPRLLSMTVST